ncbi:MAG: response regulator [Rhodospirillaceae bacterium]|nr:response regulator [Rhodospirillaceae bacterium]
MELAKILYVEDDPDIQTVARMALEMVGGYTLEVCSSGDEAIAKGPDFNPDLILLDVMMPGMDGPTTLASLREIPQLEKTTAIFMTAKVMPSDLQRYKELGAADVIPKPFDPMTLAQQVREIWSADNGQ